jgi:hypothetical protein
VFPAPGAGDGTTPGLLTGFGSVRERNTGPSSGEGVGLAASSGARTEFTTSGLASAVGEVAGRMTIRGVAEAPGEDELTAGDSAGSVEGPVFSRSWNRLAR